MSASLTRVMKPPKRFAARVDVDARSVEGGFDTLREWVEASLSGHVWWTGVQYRDPKMMLQRVYSTRQLHFKDGYWVWTFWFQKAKDAILFKLTWEIVDRTR